ncbi:hypothetical protein FNB79_11435 [Formosa sediminum]|uniref:Uncharacterized protein n=1 Tax=Formosa sediminum TaxID=2594004 RepID=A0A516GSQ3_9FLAO|nr:hypothetical protein [Formosa sediminum]QDO94551.1 hypothetical protein FNB79_11435 [Formosa sediminum]
MSSNLIIKKIFYKRHILFVICFLLFISSAFPHGDLSVRIAQKSAEIQKHPNNPNLYFERGLLYQQHVEYEKALDDYVKSEELGNTTNELVYRMAELNYLTHNYKAALSKIKVYLITDPIAVKAKKLEAQIYYKLKRYQDASQAYANVMNTMLDIRPEDVLEYCEIILAQNPEHYNKAIQIIDTGLIQLGENTLSLQLKKLDYLMSSNQHEQTIKQFDYFIQQYRRKEFWYYKKALYLVHINKVKDANIALKLATFSIAQLEPKFKNMTSIIELQAQIKILEHTLNT